MWKLWNKLFGWDYIQWRNTCDEGVARVWLDGDGRCFYWRYKSIWVCDEIKSKTQVVWLTSPSSKYMKLNV